MTHITIEREKLEQALEALEDLQRQYSIYPNSFWDWSKGRKAIATIQQALAAPTVQEPFAWCVDSENSADWAIAKTKEGVNFNAKLMDAECIKTAPFALYTTPPAAQPAVQEPVAWIDLLKKAEEVVRSKPLWKKYIDGTPLANDIAVWMAKFAQENTAAQPAPVQPDYKQLYEQVCEQYDVLAKELEATKQALAAPTVQELGARVDAVVAKIKSGISEKPTALNSYGLKIWGTVRDDLLALASPPAAQPAVQEPFGYVYEVYCLPECAWEMEWVEIFDRYEPDAEDNIRNVIPLYTTPPAAQRQWVGLTDEDKLNIEMMGGKSDVMLAEMVEAKLKERNV